MCRSTGRSPIGAAAGQRHARLAEARHERAQREDRRAHRLHQLVGRDGLGRRCAASSSHRVRRALRLHAHALEELHHGARRRSAPARCETRNGAAVSSAAAMMGSAAFFAPATRTSPESGVPPWMDSFCMVTVKARRGGQGSSSARRPFVRGQGLHGQRVDLLAHAVAERRVDELVAAHAAQAREVGAHDDGLEMRAVAAHLDMGDGRPARIDASMEPGSTMAKASAGASSRGRAGAGSAMIGQPRRRSQTRGSPRARRRTGRRSRSGSRPRRRRTD